MNSHKLKKWIILEWIIVAWGIGLRLRYFFFKMPLLPDCMMRVLIITELSYGQIFKLGHVPTTLHDPYGILVIEKFITSILGTHEYTVRVFLVVCSIAGLLLFQKIKNRFVGPLAGIVALGLFAMSAVLISYSSIVNVYGSDVLVTLLLYCLFLKIHKSSLRGPDMILFAGAGALSVWFSLPAIFVLSGGIISLALDMAVSRQHKKLVRFIPVAMVWSLSFLTYYFYALSYFSNNPMLIQEWYGYFLPLKSAFFPAICWIAIRFYTMFSFPLGVWGWVGMGLFLLGALDLFRYRRLNFMLLIIPFLVMVLASCFYKYPFGERVLLFLVPGFYLIIGRGWECLYLKEKEIAKPVVALLAAMLLFSQPVKDIKKFTRISFHKNSMMSILDEVKTNLSKGDMIYVDQPVDIVFKYYNLRYGFKRGQYMIGYDCFGADCDFVLPLLQRYKRVWVIPGFKTDLKYEYFLTALNRIGKKIPVSANKFKCFLYEINTPSDQ